MKMIKFENTEVVGFEPAIRGMRNPKNSWYLSDSGYCEGRGKKLSKNKDVYLCDHCPCRPDPYEPCYNAKYYMGKQFVIGPNDWNLMKRLWKAGTDHRKYLRMIIVYVDITAPLYWWKEFDTYKVGTVANSCSTMHKIADHEFTRNDFSWYHLTGDNYVPDHDYMSSTYILDQVIESLNFWRHEYLTGEESGIKKDKRAWWQMIQLLPSSYLQRRTVMMSYEVLANQYSGRYGHPLDEWKRHKDGSNYGFCDWIKNELPYSALITGDFDE